MAPVRHDLAALAAFQGGERCLVWARRSGATVDRPAAHRPLRWLGGRTLMPRLVQCQHRMHHRWLLYCCSSRAIRACSPSLRAAIRSAASPDFRRSRTHERPKRHADLRKRG
jgi:hypothetical protein